jgi:hypothetical protein
MTQVALPASHPFIRLLEATAAKHATGQNSQCNVAFCSEDNAYGSDEDEYIDVCSEDTSDAGTECMASLANLAAECDQIPIVADDNQPTILQRLSNMSKNIIGECNQKGNRKTSVVGDIKDENHSSNDSNNDQNDNLTINVIAPRMDTSGHGHVVPHGRFVSGKASNLPTQIRVTPPIQTMYSAPDFRLAPTLPSGFPYIYQFPQQLFHQFVLPPVSFPRGLHPAFHGALVKPLDLSAGKLPTKPLFRPVTWM